MIESTPPPSAPPRLVALGWTLLALLPVAYIALQAALFSRNIVFWDEFDTALDLVLRLDAGADGREILHRLLAINNEHRMVTSRLLFAASYWLTGTLNFHVLGAIGNLFLVAACVILIVAVKGATRRIRMAIVLAFLLFQLEHFENFLWSGASIDHFQVVMLAVGSIAALARGTPRSLLLAALLALLATFTLAHGVLTWPVGALLLAHQRRWKHLGAWGAALLLAAAAFLHGFEFNPGHRIDEPLPHATRITRYWLALLGGPLTLGDARFAPLPGALLLAGLGLVAARDGFTRAPVALWSAIFAVGALALVALGRTGIASPTEINSRYLVLGALAWALLLFLLLELAAPPQRPFRHLLWVAPALVVFNVAANARFAPVAASFIEVRDRAATTFMQHRIDGSGVTRLHPLDGHADALLRLARERGVYELPPVSHPASFPDARPSTRIFTHLDEFLAAPHAVTIGGWAMIPDHASKPGQIHVVLHSPGAQLVFTTVPLQRPDVAQAYHEPRWRWSGFRAVLDPTLLPAGDFDVGVLLADGGDAEYVMTGHRLLLSSGVPAAVRAPDNP
jgi:hypothetical protein